MKKGFTLLETIISFSIITILITLEISVFFIILSNYKHKDAVNKENFYIKEGLFFLDRKIKDCQYLKVNNGVIDIYFIEEKNSTQISCHQSISFYNGRLKIVYYENNLYKGENTIINNLESFVVETNKNIIYITIKGNTGEQYKRCYGASIKN